jgi:hypothetical protein
MDNILILDTSVGTGNRGDDIIMECARKELRPLIDKCFELTLPTHISPFHWYQVLRNSLAVRTYANAKYKFACGTNLLIPNLMTHYPQWNINLFNCKPLNGTVLLGVGAGAGAEGKLNRYTKIVYDKFLSKKLYHSARDERSKQYMERLGLKAINTGCVTMWMLTLEHCAQIPTEKSDRVIFTLTASTTKDETDQELINILLENYRDVYFWPQGHNDYDYLLEFDNFESIKVLPATIEAYDSYLTENETDYVGTRLHGGIYALRHKRRSIIIAIDERARAINADTNLPCIHKKDLSQLSAMINSELTTNINMPFEAIRCWKGQFGL